MKKDFIKFASQAFGIMPISGTSVMASINNYYSLLFVYGITQVENIISNLIAHLKDKFPDWFIRDCWDGIFVFHPESADRSIAPALLNLINDFTANCSYPMQLDISIGGFVIEKAMDLELVLEKTYIAMKIAQSKRVNIFFYEDCMKWLDHYSYRMLQSSNLMHCLIHRKVILHYQPVASADGKVILFYEALLRIVLPGNKIISAGELIIAAEAMRCVDVVDRLIVKMVLDKLKERPDLVLSVNISAYTAQDPEWFRYCEKILNDPEIARRLIFEITETGYREDYDEIARLISLLKKKGVRVALDDFGAGNTAFDQLKIFPIDIVKIDGNFVKDIDTNLTNLELVRGLVNAARSLNITTVAEHVETEEIREIVRSLGVDYLQGYFISPASDLD